MPDHDNGKGGPDMGRRYWPTARGYAALQQATPHTPPPDPRTCGCGATLASEAAWERHVRAGCTLAGRPRGEGR